MSAAPTTESRFLSSALAAYGSQIGRTALRLVTDLTLARLILDEYHGLFDLAFAAVMIAGIVRDLGLPYQLVRDEREPYGTVLAWTSGAGLVLAGALAAASPLFAGLDPRLPLVVAGLSPLLLLEGVSVAPRVFFERRLEVGRLVVPELARGAVLAAVAITLAALGWGVWAFVAGELAGMAVFAALLWTRAWRLMPRRVELPLLADLMRRSRYLFAVAMCAFALPFLERYVMAPFVSIAMVAQFGKARYFGQKVQVLLVPAVQRVLYPALVELRLHRERAFGAFRIGTVTILAFEALAAWFFFFNARTVVMDLLWGEQWEAAVPLLRILAFLPLVNPMSRLGGEVLKVRGEDRLWLIIVALDLASLLGFGILFASRWGAAGMAAAEFLLLGNLLMTWRIARILGRDFRLLAADLAFVYLVPAVPFVPVLWLFPEEGWGRFAASVAAGAVGALLLAARFHRPFRAWFSGGGAGGGEGAAA
jgi:O-antigen/teichoic acid export membrane protein